MAGEQTKTARLTNVNSGIKSAARVSKGRPVVAIESEAITTGELEAADNIIYDMPIPSNAIITEVAVYNDDLDSNGTPTLTLDVGLAAGEDFTSTTSSTETKHSEDDVLDADLLVDGSTVLQAATTSWTVQAFDSATMGPDDAAKPVWELLGYDEDPRATMRIVCTFAAAAATAAAGDLALKVTYLVD